MENMWDAFSYLTDRLNGRHADAIVHVTLWPFIWAAGRAGIWRYHNDISKSRSDRSKVIWEEAQKRRIPIEGVIAFGKPIEQYRAFVNGRWHHFNSIPVPPHLDSSVYKWIDDKGKLREFLRKNKLPVAYGGHTKTFKGALDIFRGGEPPFIVKPRSGSRGRHTTTHIYTKEHLKQAFDIAQELSPDVVIEEHLTGSVYRGTYVGGAVVGVLRGDTPRITGDGKHTVKQLISLKNKKKHKQVKDFVVTNHAIEFLSRQNIFLNTILEKNRTIDLSEKIGISYGGFAAEDTQITHPDILTYIKKAGDALGGPVIGFDFIIPDITKKPDTQRWGIIEANSLPFIDLHHFPLTGKPINVAAKIWDLWHNKK